LTLFDMGETFRVKLTARNEGVEYQDETGVYRFNVALKDRRWTVFPPPMDEIQRSRILPRVIKFLERIKWFGLFPRSYSVHIAD